MPLPRKPPQKTKNYMKAFSSHLADLHPKHFLGGAGAPRRAPASRSRALRRLQHVRQRAADRTAGGVLGSSRMWCLRMWCFMMIVVVWISHLKLVWVRGSTSSIMKDHILKHHFVELRRCPLRIVHTAAYLDFAEV